jgi:hypothetical protein
MPNNVNKLRTIPVADWSKDAAPSRVEDRVISIVCGNSNFHWALMMGMQHKFVPTLFWK